MPLESAGAISARVGLRGWAVHGSACLMKANVTSGEATVAGASPSIKPLLIKSPSW